MNVTGLVNGILARLAHYVSRITALTVSNGGVCLQLNIMLTKQPRHHAPNA
ncbi:MAG: hypothetical protein H6Q74_2743 [Firmicutes bacterium]|nr:hypothetical protein [Bacillota bacterium]